jgi:hypothetical protein
LGWNFLFFKIEGKQFFFLLIIIINIKGVEKKIILKRKKSEKKISFITLHKNKGKKKKN